MTNASRYVCRNATNTLKFYHKYSEKLYSYHSIWNWNRIETAQSSRLATNGIFLHINFNIIEHIAVHFVTV